MAVYFVLREYTDAKHERCANKRTALTLPALSAEWVGVGEPVIGLAVEIWTTGERRSASASWEARLLDGDAVAFISTIGAGPRRCGFCRHRVPRAVETCPGCDHAIEPECYMPPLARVL